jgi:hypothetical protein
MTELEQRFFHNEGYELTKEIEHALKPKSNLFFKSVEQQQKDNLFLEKVGKELKYKVFYKISLVAYSEKNGELYPKNREEALSYLTGEKSIDTDEVLWDSDSNTDITPDICSVCIHSISLKNPTKEAQIRMEEEIKLFNGKDKRVFTTA